ncbi:MAG: hypothetical protein WCQ54_02825 [Clostridiaceae bacterium]
MDNFYEQLNKTEKSPIYSIMKLLSYTFFILAAIFLIIFNFLLFSVSLIFGLVLFFVKNKFLLEYEYAYINGKLDIDVIVEKIKRKKVISFNVRDIEAYGDESLTDMTKYKHMAKIINAISTNDKNKVYGIYVIIENQKYYIRFTPDKKFYDLINRNNRRAEIR